MTTPAISVLSAVEGLQVVAPALDNYVVPLTLVILIVLFAFQKHGTARVGAFFGPVMLLWFIALAVLGVMNIADHPRWLLALKPDSHKHGTARVCAFLGPVMLLWFIALAVLGVMNIAGHPRVLLALNPYYALNFFLLDGWIAFLGR